MNVLNTVMESAKNIVSMTPYYNTLQTKNNCYVFKQSSNTNGEFDYFSINKLKFPTEHC